MPIPVLMLMLMLMMSRSTFLCSLKGHSPFLAVLSPQPPEGLKNHKTAEATRWNCDVD